jgi:hypothetical protein
MEYAKLLEGTLDPFVAKEEAEITDAVCPFCIFCKVYGLYNIYLNIIIINIITTTIITICKGVIIYYKDRNYLF